MCCVYLDNCGVPWYFYYTWFAMRPQPLPPVIAFWLASLPDALPKSWKQYQIMLGPLMQNRNRQTPSLGRTELCKGWASPRILCGLHNHCIISYSSCTRNWKLLNNSSILKWHCIKAVSSHTDSFIAYIWFGDGTIITRKTTFGWPAILCGRISSVLSFVQTCELGQAFNFNWMQKKKV